MLERLRRNAARFIAKDYRSTTPGFIAGLLRKHELTTLQERRLQLRLGFFYKVVEGLVPATTPCDFITPQKPGRHIRSTRDKSTYLPQSPVENYTRNNDRCYGVPELHTDQYRHSCFSKTMSGTTWTIPSPIKSQMTVLNRLWQKPGANSAGELRTPYRRTYASKWMISDVLIQIQFQMNRAESRNHWSSDAEHTAGIISPIV